MSFYYMFVKILPKCINLSFQESSTLAKLKKQMKTVIFLVRCYTLDLIL